MRQSARACVHRSGVALAVALAASSAQATQNLLPNGDFSPAAQVGGWTPVNGESGAFAFDGAVDADGTGGSMRVTTVAPNGGGGAASACFAVAPGAAYQYGGKFRPDNPDGAKGHAVFHCTAFTQADCSGDLPMALYAASDSGFDFTGSGAFQDLPLQSGTLDGAARSVQCVVGTHVSTSPSATVHVDDLFFQSAAPLASNVKLGGFLSGNWYDPAQPGQGFQLEFTDQASTLIAVWFVYAPDGSGQNWIFGQGEYDHATHEVTVFAQLLNGAAFPPLFDTNAVQRTLWGKLSFVFTDCDHAQVIWNSFLPGYGSGSANLSRLTAIRGLSCPSN